MSTSNGQAVTRAISEAQGADAASLAEVIGRSVALHLGGLLGELVQRVTAQPECYFCLAAAQRVIGAYSAAVANAQAAAEPVPDPPSPAVNRSVTRVPIVQIAQGPAGPAPIGCDVPACWDHLPPPAQQSRGPVAVGLVGLDGQPLSFRRA